MIYRRRNINTAGDSQDAFSTSVSDLMSGLLAIFILALSFFILNFSQATAQLTQNNVKRAAMLADIQSAMKESGVDVKVDMEHGILHIPEGVLFDIAEADIKPEGQAVINKLGAILTDVLQRPEYKDAVETVFIEGHTDNVPIETASFPSNWELSTKRAINTWLLISENNLQLKQLVNRNNQPIFSCSGYAETRPVSDNLTDKGKQDNRRIDLRFTMSPPSEEDQKIVKFIRKRLNNK